MKFIANTRDIERYLRVKIKEQNVIKNISTDSRSLKKDSLFIALRLSLIHI